jgi:hypothetical protein
MVDSNEARNWRGAANASKGSDWVVDVATRRVVRRSATATAERVRTDAPGSEKGADT